MWDETKQDVVVAADIKPLCIVPGVKAFLEGHHLLEEAVPGDHGGHAPSSPCDSTTPAAQGPGVGTDHPTPRLCGGNAPKQMPKRHINARAHVQKPPRQAVEQVSRWRGNAVEHVLGNAAEQVPRRRGNPLDQMP